MNTASQSVWRQAYSMEAIYSSFIQDYDEKEREDTAGRKTGGVNCACSFRLAKPYSTCIKLQYVFFPLGNTQIKKKQTEGFMGVVVIVK